MSRPVNFNLTEEEVRLVRRVRSTSDRASLMPLVKQLGVLMERRLTPIILRNLGFSNIESIGKANDTGPEPFDFVASRGGVVSWIQTKLMIKRSGGGLGMSGPNFEAMELLGGEHQEYSFGLLLMKVSEADDSKGTAFLFLSE